MNMKRYHFFPQVRSSLGDLLHSQDHKPSQGHSPSNLGNNLGLRNPDNNPGPNLNSQGGPRLSPGPSHNNPGNSLGLNPNIRSHSRNSPTSHDSSPGSPRLSPGRSLSLDPSNPGLSSQGSQRLSPGLSLTSSNNR